MPRSPSNITSTTTQSREPWLQDIAKGLYGQGATAIDGQSAEDQTSPYGNVVPKNQGQLTAENMAMGMGLNPNPLNSISQNFVANQMGGNQMSQYATQSNAYMGNSPHFQQMLDASNSAIAKGMAEGNMANTSARYAKAGAYGSSGWEETQRNNENALAGQLSNNTNQMLNQQYDRSSGLMESALNRANQGYESAQGRGLQAAGMAPALANMDWSNLDNMSRYADKQFQYQQANLDALNDDYFRTVNFPIQQLDQRLQWLNGIGGNGGTVVSSQPRTSSRGGQAMGGLLGLGSMMMAG